MNEEADPLLKAQKDNTFLKGEVERLKGEIRDLINEKTGLKSSVEQYGKEREQLAMILGTQNDFPIIKGEIEKLIGVEDDNEVLKTKIVEVKSEKFGEVGKSIVKTEEKIKKQAKIIKFLQGEINTLRSRRSVDRYKSIELMKELLKKSAKNMINTGTKPFKTVWLKIKGVTKHGGS